MSAYDMDLLLNKWERGTITTEQAVGQVLLLIQELSQRVGDLEKRMEQRRRTNKLQTEHQVGEEVEKREGAGGKRPLSDPSIHFEENTRNFTESP